ncbi:hypothetical protein ACIHJG_33995 [Streptomyces sp. NPDC052415]|uniref:hypothetical protein n=1 Tax=Streptomyces sp. NPDC052415 TaxID=3365690 RepID=UPI0037D32FDC
MAADEPDAGLPGGNPARQPEDHATHAIKWFTEDRSRTRQIIDRPDGPIDAGRLLGLARFDVQVNRLLNGQPAVHAQALVRAQAEWLIRWMPGDHQPLSLDSAQQAGRAWGVLITSDTETLPD